MSSKDSDSHDLEGVLADARVSMFSKDSDSLLGFGLCYSLLGF